MKSFGKGGVHPADKKTAANQVLKPGPSPDTYIIPTTQHLGAPAKIIVHKGDEIKKYQLLAEQNGFVSMNIHSPISGTVSEIAPYPTPHMGNRTAIHITTAIEANAVEKKMPILDWPRTSIEELLERIKQAGICGLGGATFPTFIKLSPPKDKPIDTFIINSAECEPYLTCDHRLLLEYPEDIITGIEIAKKILNVKTVIIGIENNKRDAIRKWQQKYAPQWLSVIPLKTRYPQGAEKQLIKALTGREVPSAKLPMDVGCLVLNTGTCQAIKKSICDGIPLVERALTITGDCVKPQNMIVKIGTLFRDIVKQAGGLTQKPYKIIMGGPMMGVASPSLDVPVIKGTSGILLLSRSQTIEYKENACIRCGNCVSACPMNLMTAEICLQAEFENFDQAKVLNVLDCIECGCCSFVCPQKRPLVHYIKNTKAQLKKRQ